MPHCVNKLFYYLVLSIAKKYVLCFGVCNPYWTFPDLCVFTLVKTWVSFSNNVLTTFLFLVFNLYTLSVVKQNVVILLIGKFTWTTSHLHWMFTYIPSALYLDIKHLNMIAFKLFFLCQCAMIYCCIRNYLN